MAFLQILKALFQNTPFPFAGKWCILSDIDDLDEEDAGMLELLLGGAGSGKTYTVFEEHTRLAEQEAPARPVSARPRAVFPLKAKGRASAAGAAARLPCSGVELYTSCADGIPRNWEGLPENGWTTGHGHCS